jgi:twitching motility protein PilT
MVIYMTTVSCIALRNVARQRPTQTDGDFLVAPSVRFIGNSQPLAALRNDIVVAARSDAKVLITGETGAGKSTTLAALIEYLNSQSNLRIVTIEEPVEYRFESRRCLIQQREVGFDVPSFELAVEHTLQQDPDVIVIGEIRNLATLQAAFRAASSGHLVYATLHTSSAAKTLQRIQDLYPIEFRHQALSDTAAFLAAVISQTLLPSRDGKRRHLAHEIMTVNPKLRAMIRDAKWLQIRGEVDRRAPLSHLLNHSLAALVAGGLVDHDVARAASEDAGDLESRIGDLAAAEEGRR